MNIINIIPTPPQALRLALSLFNSSILGTSHKTSERVAPRDFDVDAETGFFPPRPLPRLPTQFDAWESALEEAREVLYLGDDDSDMAIENRAAGEQWRAMIRSWPILSTESLHTELRLCQRAHLILAWLVNFYVHSLPPSQEKTPTLVPKSLAIPLVQVSRCLGMAPVLTFADTVLWNWEFVDPSRPMSAENIRFVNIFSKTEDERNFYMASAAAELRGVEFLRIIEEYNNLPDLADFTSVSKVARDLNRLAGIIDDLSDIIQSVRNGADPHVFYWEIRPWYEGSGAKGPTDPGWIYEGVPNSDKLALSGPSAGQSSVMHALDLFLNIDHKLQHRRTPAPSEANKKADHGFMERMRLYMPGKHREYLENIAASPRPLRELARHTAALREPFDATVMALKRLRDLHMRIAVLYIVTMSRSSPLAAASAVCPVAAAMAKMQARQAAGEGPARGTGGNELSLLLKAGRDATRRTLLKEF